MSAVWILLYMNVDIKSYLENYNKVNSELANKYTASLINANTIHNLPHLNLMNNISDLNSVRACVDNPVKVGELGSQADLLPLCQSRCGNSGQLVEIDENTEFYSNETRLSPGIWCMINPPDCNLNKSVVLATVTGNTCMSKFPQMFDSTGYNVIACNSVNNFSPKNQLWDFKNNEPVDAILTDIEDANELLPSGEFRFRCKLDFDPSTQNKFIPNFLDEKTTRFLPIQDKCLSGLYAAPLSVGVKVSEDSYVCDCGNFQDTRLVNRNNDPKQPCTACTTSETVAVPGFPENVNITVPYNCFTLGTNTPDAQAIGIPCPAQKFTQSNVGCSMMQLHIVRGNISLENFSHQLSIMPLFPDFYKQYPNQVISDVLKEKHLF